LEGNHHAVPEVRNRPVQEIPDYQKPPQRSSFQENQTDFGLQREMLETSDRGARKCLRPSSKDSPSTPRGATELAVMQDYDARSIKTFVNKAGNHHRYAQALRTEIPSGDRFFMGILKSKTPFRLWDQWQDVCAITKNNEEDPSALLVFLRTRAQRYESQRAVPNSLNPKRNPKRTLEVRNTKAPRRTQWVRQPALKRWSANEQRQGVPEKNAMPLLKHEERTLDFPMREVEAQNHSREAEVLHGQAVAFPMLFKHPRGRCPVKDQNCSRGCKQQHHQMLCPSEPLSTEESKLELWETRRTSLHSKVKTGGATPEMEIEVVEEIVDATRITETRETSPTQARAAVDQDVPEAANLAVDDLAYQANDSFCNLIPRHIRLIPIYVRKRGRTTHAGHGSHRQWLHQNFD